MALFAAMLSTVAHARSQESHYFTDVHDSILEEILIYLADETLSDQEVNEYLEVLEEQYPDVYQILVAEGILFDPLYVHQDKDSHRVNQSGVNTLLAQTKEKPCVEEKCIKGGASWDLPLIGKGSVSVGGCITCKDNKPGTAAGTSGGTSGGGMPRPGGIGPGGGGLDSEWWDNYRAGGCGGIC